MPTGIDCEQSLQNCIIKCSILSRFLYGENAVSAILEEDAEDDDDDDDDDKKAGSGSILCNPW